MEGSERDAHDDEDGGSDDQYGGDDGDDDIHGEYGQVTLLGMMLGMMVARETR